MPHEPPAESVQERYAPRSICFGCGPANERGLRIRSFPEGDGLVAVWTPQPHHQAFDGAVSGGVIGALFDCHCNWTAAWHLMNAAGASAPPATVTASYAVQFTRPTPSELPLTFRSHVVQSAADRATVEATLEADGRVCATCRGTFVAVRPGHPAFRRWE
jgi:acyl-coenzyme A thioesterase PaaI-like protein